MDTLPSSPSQSDAAQDQTYLTFLLCEKAYCVPVQAVVEIVMAEPGRITPMPEQSPHMRGMIDLRGTIRPVLDLRRRFGMPDRPGEHPLCLIVLEIGEEAACMLVDEVREVVRFAPEDIVPPPRLAQGAQESMICGLCKGNKALTLLLNHLAVFDAQELLPIASQI